MVEFMQYALLGDLHSHYEKTKMTLDHIHSIAPHATLIGLGDLYECTVGKRRAPSVRNAPLNEVAIISEIFEELLTFPSIIGNQEERIGLVTGLQRFLAFEERIVIEHATLIHGHQFEWDEHYQPIFPTVETPLLFFGHSHRAAIYVNNERRSVPYGVPLEVSDQPYVINVGAVVESAEWCLYDSKLMTVTFMRA